jgi:hypothetical protein
MNKAKAIFKEYKNVIQDDKKYRSVPKNNQWRSLDKSTLEAYERYVLAQFKFDSQEAIEKERKQAIESLIPGTKNFYHLYFLDLVKKKKKLIDFSDEEKDLYKKFNSQYGQSQEFYEVEMWIMLLNRIELMTPTNEDTHEADIDENLNLIDYLQDNFLNNRESSSMGQRPQWMDDHNNDSSQSENEDNDASKARKLETKNFTSMFSKEEKLKEILNYYKRNKSLNHQEIIGFDNDVDWDQILPEHVYSHALWMSRNARNQKWVTQFWELSSDKFFNQVAMHFVDKFKKHKEDPRKHSKFYQSEHFFVSFSIE